MTSSGKLVAIAFFGAALVALGVWRNGGWALLWPLAAIGVLGIAWVLKARLPEGWRNWAGVTSTQLLFLGAVVAVLLVAGVEVPLWWEVLWIVTWGLAGQCITTFD